MWARLLHSLLILSPLALFATQDANFAINPGVLSPSGGEAALEPFVLDTFSDANATGLPDHLTGEIGATWVEHSSFSTTVWQIRDNRAVTNNALDTAMAYASGEPPTADYDVVANIRIVSANYTASGTGIAARVSESPVNSMVFFRYGTSGFQCFQTSTGTSLQIGVSSAPTLTVGADYQMQLTVIGNTVTGYVNGISVCTGTTTVLSAGRVGVRGATASQTTGPHISDIQATERPASAFVEDSFVDPNATALTSHTPTTGGSWVNHSSFTGTIWQIRDNRAVTNNASNTAMSYVTATPPSADYYVVANMNVVSANYTSFGTGIAARVSESPVNTMIFMNYGTSGFRCFQTSAGTNLQIGISSTPTLTVGADYELKLSVDGDAVVGTVNGVPVCTGTTTVLSAGKVGVRGATASTTTGPHLSDIQAVLQ